MSVLVTGYPGFLAQRLIRRELEEQGSEVFVLTQEKHAGEAADFLARVPGGSNAEILTGDVCYLDLGLAGKEVHTVHRSVRVIHHAAEVSYLGLSYPETRDVNVGGTRSLLDFATDCEHLDRLIHYSTVFVSGGRRGVILESELESDQSFRNHWEHTKYEAEVIVRGSMHRVPTSIIRPGIIIGDSRTGEIGRLDGPYYLMALMILAPSDAPLPLPGHGGAPMNIVPIDFVADVALRIARNERAEGLTFHVTDPNPVSAQRVFEIVARSAGRRPPSGYVPASITRWLMRAPFVERFFRSPRQFVDYFDHLALYSCRNTLQILDGAGISCPSFESYADVIIAYVKTYLAARGKSRPETAAPEAGDESLQTHKRADP